MDTSSSSAAASRRRGCVAVSLSALAVITFPILLLLLSAFVWFYCRVEPGANGIAILVRKTGADLPDGQILAESPGQKGVQLEVLPEGRYFLNPYTWEWIYGSVTDIPAGKMGVLTRLFGADPPNGQIFAGEGQKGIVKEVLGPGKYRINPYAYSVGVFDAISIRPGCVGVVTSLVGLDPFDPRLPADQRNSFLVSEGCKGVQAAVLDPGTYYLNPYMFNVIEVTLQSQRFAMSGEDAISFLSEDGFAIRVEGTIEFAIRQESAALLSHRVGDMDDVVNKLILPRARGFSRIEGSKHPAVDFIVGETRQKFQKDLESHLMKQCEPWGVIVKSVLIRDIDPPDEVASLIREREVAVQDAIKFKQEREQAKSKAELVRQEMLALQNKAKVEAETARLRAVIAAQQDQAVRLTMAGKDLDVAQLERETAAAQAEAILARAKAEADVVSMRNQAEYGVAKARAAAFGGGLGLARMAWLEAVAPKISHILTTDDGGSLGPVIERLAPVSSEAGR